MTKFTVIGGKASQNLAKRIARKLKADYINTELRIFPDGESKITFSGEPKKGEIIVVQSTYPPVDSNLLQCLLLVSKAKQYSENVIAVVPYLGYARQDKEFLTGEIVSIHIISKLFKAVGATKIIVVDIHSTVGLKYFKIPAKNISAISEQVKFFKKLNLKNPLVVSPDFGGKTRAKEFASLFNTDYIALKKQRSRKTGQVKIISTNLKHVTNRDIILVDDMISSGGSIIKATEFLKKQKCKRVFVSCTHALLVNNAEKKIKKAGVSEIISTNTIPGTTSKVDVSNIIAKAVL
ncbi:MAG TPA: ribose-phosphate pyrophosphokinase [Nitrosopumilaceae archaeon]|nr:ribose-phosphate pyrophosphokinase [Nitrosopumilaceae archaeon]